MITSIEDLDAQFGDLGRELKPEDLDFTPQDAIDEPFYFRLAQVGEALMRDKKVRLIVSINGQMLKYITVAEHRAKNAPRYDERLN